MSDRARSVRSVHTYKVKYRDDPGLPYTVQARTARQAAVLFHRLGKAAAGAVVCVWPPDSPEPCLFQASELLYEPWDFGW